jgi:hypothetical protein
MALRSTVAHALGVGAWLAAAVGMAAPLPPPFSGGSIPPDVVTEQVERQLAAFFTKEVTGTIERCSFTVVKRLFAAQQRGDANAAASANAAFTACLSAERQAWSRFRDGYLADDVPACLASAATLDGMHDLWRNQVMFAMRLVFCDGTSAISGLHVPADVGTYRLLAKVGKIFAKFANRHAQCLLKYVERLAAAGGDAAAADAARVVYDGCYVQRAHKAYGAMQRLYASTSGPLCLDANGAQGLLQGDVALGSILESVYCAE